MNIIPFDTFVTNLRADEKRVNIPREVLHAHFSFVQPAALPNPSIVHVSKDVAQCIGINENEITTNEFLSIFSGSKILVNTQPYAACYGGHQFGSWAGQLGDGRVVNLFEVKNENQLYTVQLKGAGVTPYARFGDGKAVLRSCIREHLCSEAMFYLGVPTSRSLCCLLTGEEVNRDLFYDGHPKLEKGALNCRVAESFIRFGNFQIFAARNDLDNLKLLADYTISHYFKEIESKNTEKYVQFFQSVCSKTISVLLHWQRVGFVHGVLNTDNMSIHGLTIDYGPFGFLDNYDLEWTPNTTDNTHKRYCFGRQPEIVLWNLWQLANALYPLHPVADDFENILKELSKALEVELFKLYKSKIGLYEECESDAILQDELIRLLQQTSPDMTIFFRNLSEFKKDKIYDSIPSELLDSFYQKESLNEKDLSDWIQWFNDYKVRLKKEKTTDEVRKERMNQINPKFILRNYVAQMAIEQADEGNYDMIEELFELLKNPYSEQPTMQQWFAKRPDWAKEKAGCSALSCSS